MSNRAHNLRYGNGIATMKLMSWLGRLLGRDPDAVRQADGRLRLDPDLAGSLGEAWMEDVGYSRDEIERLRETRRLDHIRELPSHTRARCR